MSIRTVFFGRLGRRAAWFTGAASEAAGASPLIFGFFAAGFLDRASWVDEGVVFFFFFGARLGSSSTGESSGSSSLPASSSAASSSGDSFSTSSSSTSASRFRLVAAGASGLNFSGAFVTRPERRAVEVGAGELVAVLSEVSMSGCRVDGITFGVVNGGRLLRSRGGEFLRLRFLAIDAF